MPKQQAKNAKTHAARRPKHTVATRARFAALVDAIVADDRVTALRLLKECPALARHHSTAGASRRGPASFFLSEIRHHLYSGDTALHVAAAGFRREIARALIRAGAGHSVRNRRGAQPLHYAADTNTWDPKAQAATIRVLLTAGADPNAIDRSGVAPLHRAVRTRSAAAVEALLEGGAEPRLRNKNGSTPLDLAMSNTGRAGSGISRAIEQQAIIIAMLTDRA